MSWRLPPARALHLIDVSVILGQWGWEGYADGRQESEDSNDIELDEGVKASEATDEQILLGLGLSLCNPLAPGCEARIYRDGQEAVIYRWTGDTATDVAETSKWKVTR